MIAVSAEAWHAILCLITPWKYQKQRLGILIYILSRLGSILLCLAFYSISHHALAVSATLVLSHTQWLPELHQLEFRSDFGVLPLQAMHVQFQFSLVSSVRVHVQVGTLPTVLSESRYITAV